MPDPKTQRYVGWIAFIGVLTSCFGCSLFATNQVTPGAVFLLAAQAILLPLFVYLLRTRRQLKRVVRQRDAGRQQQLDALANIQNVLGTTPSTSQEPKPKSQNHEH